MLSSARPKLVTIQPRLHRHYTTIITAHPPNASLPAPPSLSGAPGHGPPSLQLADCSDCSLIHRVRHITSLQPVTTSPRRPALQWRAAPPHLQHPWAGAPTAAMPPPGAPPRRRLTRPHCHHHHHPTPPFPLPPPHSHHHPPPGRHRHAAVTVTGHVEVRDCPQLLVTQVPPAGTATAAPCPRPHRAQGPQHQLASPRGPLSVGRRPRSQRTPSSLLRARLCVCSRGHPVEGVSALHPHCCRPTASASASREASSRSPRRVAARSLALPFFPSMTEQQVERVCTALAERPRQPPLDSAAACPASPKSRIRCFGGSTPRSPSTGAWRRSTSSSRARTPAPCGDSACSTRTSWRDRRGPRRGRAPSSRAAASSSRSDDEDIHMAIERRLTELIGPRRRQAPHRALAQRPGGDRSGAAGRARTPRARSRCSRR